MKRLISITMVVFCISVPFAVWASKASEGASEERGIYLAERGMIVPPDEIYIDSYIGSIDYSYPIPASSDFGVSMYSGHRQLSVDGQEEIIQIGIQAGKEDFEELPPMNLAFVIDHSGSMADADKLDWVKDAFDIFIEQVRDVDYVSLVIFDDRALVVFPATRMDSREVRMQFKRAVHSIYPGGKSAGRLKGSERKIPTR